MGLLRCAGPSNVQAFSRCHGLLVRLFRRLQHRELRPRAGVLRRHRQRPSKRHRRSGRWRRGSYARPRNRSAPGSGTKHPRGGRHRCTVSPSPRARSQAGGGVSDGAAAPRLKGGGGLCARRMRAGAGHTGPRPHQRRLQRRQPGHASASEPEAYCRRDAAAGHASPLDARGAKPTP
jgi:hypothetical protein